MSYPITSPVTFDIGAPGAELDFNSDASLVGQNKIKDFVTNAIGDMVYRENGPDNYLTRLPVGTAAQFLGSDGTVPLWKVVSGTPTTYFMAHVSGSVAGIPTSRNLGANPGVWFPLDNTYVTWSTASPGTNVGAAFSTATGTFTVPTSAVYTISAQVTFDSGVGVTAGSGITGSIPNGSACRQIRIRNTTNSTNLSVSVRQVEASNTNCTQVYTVSSNVDLTAGHTIRIEVRHDRTATNTVTVGDPLISAPFMTYFTVRNMT
jgi:hypothetical protein